jgi:hypothetical protein
MAPKDMEMRVENGKKFKKAELGEHRRL